MTATTPSSGTNRAARLDLTSRAVFYPFPLVETLGLEQALGKVCQRMCDHGSFELSYESEIDEHAIDPHVALAAFQIAQDTLSHAVTYRRPEFVSVSLTQEGPNLHLRVQDMGEPSDLSQSQTTDSAEHSFCQKIAERAARCTGEITITRGKVGTAVSVPLSTASRESVSVA